MNIKFDYDRIDYWRRAARAPVDNSTHRLAGTAKPLPTDPRRSKIRPCPTPMVQSR